MTLIDVDSDNIYDISGKQFRLSQIKINFHAKFS